MPGIRAIRSRCSLPVKSEPVAWLVCRVEAVEPRRLLAAISWDGGGDGVSWSDPANWLGNQAPSPGDAVTISVPGSTPTIQLSGFVTVSSLTCDESLSVAGELRVEAGMTLNATVTLGNDAGTTSGVLSFSTNSSTSPGEQTLGGTGTIVFGGGFGNRIVNGLVSASSGTKTLTIGPGITIRGKAGRIESSGPSSQPAPVVNQGRIIAEQEGAAITVGTGIVFTNAGTVEANPGRITLSSTVTNYASGTLTGGTWVAQASPTNPGQSGLMDFPGGTVLTTIAANVTRNNAGVFRVLNSSANILRPTTIAAGGSLTLGSNLGLPQSLTNHGKLNLAGGSLTLPNGGGFTQTSTGTLEVLASNSAASGINGGTLNAGGAFVVRAAEGFVPGNAYLPGGGGVPVLRFSGTPNGAFASTTTVDAGGTFLLSFGGSEGRLHFDRAPTAVADAVGVRQGTEPYINVLQNDSDLEPSFFFESLGIVGVSQPAPGAGSVRIQDPRTVRFIPAFNFVGTATFTYTIADAAGNTATAPVTVRMTPTWLNPLPLNASSWDPATNTLTVTGAAVVDSNFGSSARPRVVASGASASLAITTSAGTSVTLGGLALSDGATANFADGTAGRVLVIDSGGLTLSGTAKLDLADNALVVRGGSIADVRNAISSGFHGGDWLGAGLTSSAAANDVSRASALGYSTFGALGRNDFEGVTGLQANDVVVRYTYYGDTNLDRLVNTDDILNILAAGKLDTAAAAAWYEGDMTFNSQVDTDDILQILAAGRLDQM